MEDFNSKYTGQQVEDLLDQVASGNAGGGGGNITEVYITDFDVYSIELLMRNAIPHLGLDKQGLMDALAAHKVILVPYEISDNITSKGYCALVGFYEDLIYIKVVTEYSEIIIETALDTQYILSQEVTKRNWYDKQDVLKSGENIKTFNGESLLGEGDITTPTFLRIGDTDDEAKANFIAVANGEKSADYYICSSRVQNTPIHGIATSLGTTGPTNSPVYVKYDIYGSTMSGELGGKLLKITTKLTTATGEITTTYETILDAKQDAITDLEDIRGGASKGSTAIQPNDVADFVTAEDLAAVATSGDYNDLTNKPTIPAAVTESTVSGWGFTKNTGTYSKPSGGIPKSDLESSVQTSLDKANSALQPGDVESNTYIANFSYADLHNAIREKLDIHEANIAYLVSAMQSNKIILVREDLGSDYSGFYVLNGYMEGLVYFSVTNSNGDTIVCDGVDKNAQDLAWQSLSENIMDNKQDKLVSGENIKTINGESILGSGDIPIGGGSSDGGTIETLYEQGGLGYPIVVDEMLAEKRYYLYVDGDSYGNDQSIVIGGFEGNDAIDTLTIKHFYAVINAVASRFGTSAPKPFNISLILPDVNIKWVNNLVPTIVGEGLFELSITQINDYGIVYYNAVLTPFKPVE